MEHANIQQLPITKVLEQNICFCMVVIFLAEKLGAFLFFPFDFFFFPGKEGYLKVLTWDSIFICAIQQIIVIRTCEKPHMGIDLRFKGTCFWGAHDYNAKVKEV